MDGCMHAWKNEHLLSMSIVLSLFIYIPLMLIRVGEHRDILG